ncbi:helix-turn-helix domain-containing protein [Plantibacter sp. MMLR14_011]|uniref:helix-turn-helix domain-containing protein n=1 Tax=Plantibacter sp. MMLR14_011 TaxID=1898746 RepID=UPI0008DD0458|nr:helix-turn-helix domain-containing protein [Plantibacter sp. MMLR14_011]OII40015.1 hypothetical protein BIU99_06175 [Plantibacter sp. MMLR14_011]
MQELVGRLTALDPEASEGLKVIAYFDALVAGGVNTEALARGAAVLTGVPAGVRSPEAAVRVDPAGHRLPVGPSDWPTRTVAGDGSVWLERVGAAHANDAIVLERFALAVALLRSRRHPQADSSVQILLDADRSESERSQAAERLSLSGSALRAVATAPSVHPPGGPSALVVGAGGMLRATIVSGPDGAAGLSDVDGVAGIGRAGVATQLVRSWAEAQQAITLTDAAHRVVDIADLGVLADAVRELAATAARSPDVSALAALDNRAARVLDALVRGDSVRSAAQELGIHHSTLQGKHEHFARILGYDPREPVGRARYELASLLLRSMGR